MQEAATGAVAAAGEALGVSTPAAADADADAERKAAEAEAAEQHRLRREAERRSQLAEAEELVHSADRTVMQSLPYPFNLLLGVSVFGITLWRYLVALLIIGLAIYAVHFFRVRFRRAGNQLQSRQNLTRWQTAVNVLLVPLRNPVKLVLFGRVLRLVSSLLVTAYHPDVVWISNLILFAALVLYLYDLVGMVDQVYGATIFRTGNNRLMETVRPMILRIVRIFILVIGGTHIYQDLTGRTMVSVLAGLGIGGLALALASQEMLRNLLGFASIAFDKAFLVGDAVSIANYDGTVEHVGMRSMRLRTYDGSSVVIPNNTAINSNITNLNRRPYIRRLIRIHLSPKNPYPKVERALDVITAALETHEGKVPGLPPVVRFEDYEPARFVIQALFWYDADKPFYPDECSRINLEIAKRLFEEGIEYAEH
ncbi:MAG: mechanosensitive ion channel family protein [Planctomycetaceae bacterium]|nr:mechanosensitive ion channel family protein [Planctomycetaceae bacterium]